MTPTFRRFFLGLASVLLIGFGCGSGPSAGPRADSGPDSTSAYPDAEDIADRAGVWEAGAPDGGADGSKPPPMSAPGNVRLFHGTAQLITHGPACSGGNTSATDRWCAFTASSTNRIGFVDLYVINVTRAAAGVAITCDGGTVDPNCLKLTGGFAEESTDPVAHAARFQGDTLVYFDQTLTAYGWRPGMFNGRVLVTDSTGSVHDCYPSAMGNSILCLKDLATQSTAGVVKSDMLVGHLDALTDPPLTRVDTVISNDTTIQTLQRFRFGFRPDGEYVAWSSSAAAGGVEILKTQRVADDSTRITVAEDVSRWWLSPDGAHFYWLSQFNYDKGGMRAGTLQIAPFPTGTAPTTLLANVGDFTLTDSGAIVARTMVTNSHGDLKAIVDPIGAPTTITTLDTGVYAVLSTSPKGYVAYAKAADFLYPLVNLYVTRIDGSGSVCALTGEANALTKVLFLPSERGVVWASVTNLDSTFDTALILRESFTRLSDCSTVSVANNIGGSWGIAGDNGILIEDEYDGVDGTLHIQKVTGGETLAGGPPDLIQTRVNNFVPVTSTPRVLLFTVAAGTTDDGVYLRAIE